MCITDLLHLKIDLVEDKKWVKESALYLSASKCKAINFSHNSIRNINNIIINNLKLVLINQIQDLRITFQLYLAKNMNQL